MTDELTEALDRLIEFRRDRREQARERRKEFRHKIEDLVFDYMRDVYGLPPRTYDITIFKDRKDLDEAALVWYEQEVIDDVSAEIRFIFPGYREIGADIWIRSGRLNMPGDIDELRWRFDSSSRHGLMVADDFLDALSFAKVYPEKSLPEERESLPEERESLPEEKGGFLQRLSQYLFERKGGVVDD